MKIILDGKEVNLNGKRVSDIFTEMKLNPEVFLVKRNSEIVHEYEMLSEGDRIEMIKVISGG